jgi:hypothetical protein
MGGLHEAGRRHVIASGRQGLGRGSTLARTPFAPSLRIGNRCPSVCVSGIGQGADTLELAAADATSHPSPDCTAAACPAASRQNGRRRCRPIRRDELQKSCQRTRVANRDAARREHDSSVALGLPLHLLHLP